MSEAYKTRQFLRHYATKEKTRLLGLEQGLASLRQMNMVKARNDTSNEISKNAKETRAEHQRCG